MSKIIKKTKTNKSEKIGEIIANVISLFIIGAFLFGISTFIYNFVTTLINGGSFNI